MSFIQATGEDNQRNAQFCIDRGLLPIGLLHAFEVLGFVSRTVLSAHQAQRKYGIPASVLMAIGMLDHGYDAQDVAGDQSIYQGCVCCLAPNIGKWFMEKAEHLATKFKEAMPFVDDVKAYIKSLRDLSFCDNLYAIDVLALIEAWDLEECDLAAILVPGEFDRSVFKPMRDDAGRVQLVPALDMRTLIAPPTWQPMPVAV